MITAKPQSTQRRAIVGAVFQPHIPVTPEVRLENRTYVSLFVCSLAFAFFAIFAVNIGAVHAQGEPTANLFNRGPQPIPPFAPGVVLMGMREDAVSAAALLEGLEISAQESLDLRGLDGGQGTGGVTGLRLHVPPGLEWTVIERLQQHPAVVFAEPDWVIQIAQVPSVAQAALETPFAVSDTLYTEQWYLQRINMSRGWAAAQQVPQGDPLRVAIIDTGVDYDHPDLQGRLRQGRNYVTPLPGTRPAVDDNGHGTHIAGLIGALVNNVDGMAGAALAVELEPIKTQDEQGDGLISNVAAAIRDTAGAGDGVDIINLSLQIERNVDSPVLRSAVNYAVGQGALVIAAAGNCKAELGCPVFYPAALENVLAVGATTYTDAPAHYTPTGPEIDLVAPGGGSGPSILSTWSRVRTVPLDCDDGAGNSLLRTVGDGIYCPKDGTSMAAALVTGVAALVWSMDRDLSAEEVRAILLESAFPLNAPATQVGAGRLDATAAARFALPAQLLVPHDELVVHLPVGSGLHTVPLALENPSLEPVTWTLTTTRALDWLTIETPGGTARYGEAAQARLAINATHLPPGRYTANLRLTGKPRDGIEVDQIVPVVVAVYAETPPRSFLPLVAVGSHAAPVWLKPNAAGRQPIALSGDDETGLDLPFEFPLHGQTVDEARLFADGFMAFPATVGVSSLPNHCFANWLQTEAGVYAWWADLEPGAAGSQVSTFQPDGDRFVVEFVDVPSAAGVSPAYVVSFQIVLHRSGRVDLHYGSLPDEQQAQPQVTVGVRSPDGRFYNQIACRTGTTVLGRLPQTHDSITLEAKDLY